jgi:hypothetical protein
MRLVDFSKVVAVLVVLVACTVTFAQSDSSVTFAQSDQEPARAVPLGVATKAEPTLARIPVATRATAVSSLVASVLIDGKTTITGTILETTELPMKTTFGAATIPLSEVAGIRLPDEGTGSTTVVLHNGDVLTGATALDLLVIATEWGKAEINGPNISSILFNQGVKWVSEEGLTGKRWKLAESEVGKQQPVAKGAPQQTGPATRSLIRTQTGYYYR